MKLHIQAYKTLQLLTKFQSADQIAAARKVQRKTAGYILLKLLAAELVSRVKHTLPSGKFEYRYSLTAAGHAVLAVKTEPVKVTHDVVEIELPPQPDVCTTNPFAWRDFKQPVPVNWRETPNQWTKPA